MVFEAWEGKKMNGKKKEHNFLVSLCRDQNRCDFLYATVIEEMMCLFEVIPV